MSKKIISVILAISVLVLTIIPAYSVQSDAKVYSFYSDNMLFKQNEDAVIAGTAEKGCEITAELFDDELNLVKKGETAADENGTFAVSFDAPEGGFNEYSISIKANGKEIKNIKNVVFGELWLASGQSNMQYPLGQAKNFSEAVEKYKKQSDNLRVLMTPFYSELDNTVGKIPSMPLADIPNSEWIKGNDSGIYGMSAVAYFFANKMIEELDMPVGILNVSLGGTTIASWISRAAIESNEQVKNYFIEYGKYVELSDWDKDVRSLYYEMSTNYNFRVEALRHFKLSGMIWYQGETDIGWSSDAYSRAFDLLQHSYTELFRYENGLLPIVFTQLASYFYSDDGWELPARNVDFSEIQQLRPDSRALISIYDIPLTYIPEAGVIHPESKLEVGERMAHSAMGLIYDKNDSYTAATVAKSEIRESAIYVTFRNIGDGLKQNGTNLKGFSICGTDGIYVKADAEIISKDTVKIWNDSISSPCSAAYAYSLNNEKANLYASHGNIPVLPVSPFVTDRSIGSKYWSEKTWADCDDLLIWHTVDDVNSGYYSSWISENAEFNFDLEDYYGGTASLKINSTNNQFTISPVFTYKSDIFSEMFYDTDTDYSGYGKISVYVKNSGNDKVTIENIKFNINSFLWYSPAVENTVCDSVSIPADGKWHCVSFDLNKVYLRGNEFGFSYSNKVLSKIDSIDFCFSSESEDAVLYLDEIRFESSAKDSGLGFDADINAADSIFEYLSALFVNFIGKIVSIFK